MSHRGDYLLLSEAADFLGVSQPTINKYLGAREISHFPLPVVATPNAKLFNKQEIQQWKEFHKAQVQQYYKNKSRSNKINRESYINQLIQSIQ